MLWQGMASRHYRHKLRLNAGFREFAESHAAEVAAHWGHEQVVDRFGVMHLASQLYELTEMLQRRLAPIGDAAVLDAGASDGMFLARLGVRRGVGVNFLQSCVQGIRKDGYLACTADVERLPFASKSFDYVICCETLEHVPNPIATLNELARVCRKRVVVTIPWLPRTRINRRPAGWPEVEAHILEFSEADFLKIVTHARVRVMFQGRVQVFPEPRNPVLQWWLSRWMYPSFFPKLQYYEFEPL